MHTSEGRRTSRYAVKLYGANTPVTRAQVEALDPKFVGGSFAQRSKIAATTKDPEVLRLALADTDAVILGALKNPRIDPKILDAATTTTAKTLIVIDNPNVRNATLRRLVSEAKGSVQRAALVRLMSRGDDISMYIEEGSEQVREELAIRTADPRIRAALLDDASPLVRERAVRNHHVPHGLPLTIADDPSARVLLAAAKVTNSSALLERLAYTNDVLVQKAIMKNPAVTDDAVHTLALSGSERARDELVRRGLTGRPVEKVIKDRYSSEFEIREAYKNADNLDAFDEILADHPGNAEAMRQIIPEKMRLDLAAHFNAPDDLKIAHLKNQPKSHWLALAEGDHISPPVLEKLALIENQEMRLALIMNERTPAKIIRRYAGLKNKITSDAAREELARRE